MNGVRPLSAVAPQDLVDALYFAVGERQLRGGLPLVHCVSF